MTTTKSAGVVAALEASVSDQLRRQVIPEIKRQEQLTQAPIRAVLIGSDRCEAEGVSACGYAPALPLCRQLIAAGYNPTSPLEAWRGPTLCLRVRSIGAGAQLTVEDDSRGTPHLRRWRDRSKRYGAGSPVAQTAGGLGVVATPEQPATQGAAP